MKYCVHVDFISTPHLKPMLTVLYPLPGRTEDYYEALVDALQDIASRYAMFMNYSEHMVLDRFYEVYIFTIQ